MKPTDNVFPVRRENGSPLHGIRVRDYIAIEAMKALIRADTGFEPREKSEADGLAEAAYLVADAVIRASEPRSVGPRTNPDVVPGD